MSREVIASVVGLGLLLNTGCTGIGGHHGTHVDEYHGDLKILGHLNTVTVLPGSDLRMLKVAGDGNKVHISENVTLGKIEIWGENDVVTIPERLIVRTDIVGIGSKVVRRPQGAGPAPIGPEGEKVERIPVESGVEHPPAPQPAPQPAPAGTPRTDTDTSPSASPPPASNPPSSSGSGTSVTPAGERVIPPAGIQPGGGN